TPPLSYPPSHSYEWTLQCPGAASQTFTGPQPYITAGSSSSNVDIGTRYTPFDCNLTLVVTDRSLRTSGINTRITITCGFRRAGFLTSDKGAFHE
ncbi:hypothetical protein, partial [Salmonella enterica]|uniref:hypothetical protein n=1 Tax=Salmonella enterica TaxID=28901 RepID=UPI003524D3CE